MELLFMKAFKPDSNPLGDKFATTHRKLSAALIERDEEIDIVLTALVPCGSKRTPSQS
jgi:MoxR-like ATPase